MGITDLSRSTRVRLNPDGSVIEDINVDNGVPLGSKGLNGPSKYSTEVHRIVRETIPQIGDKLVAKYLGGRVVPESESRLYDVILKNNTAIEVKTSRIGSTAFIREGQLNKLGKEDLYALVYFETQNNRSQPPSFHVHKCIEDALKTPAAEYLRQKIRIKTLLIFPRPTMVYFFNTSPIRLLYNAHGIPYKALCRNRAEELFHNNPDGFDTITGEYNYGRHEIEVFHMGEYFTEEQKLRIK